MTTDWNPRTPTFTQHGDLVLVDDWPSQIEIDAALMASADPALMAKDGERITITPSNGLAVYAVVEYDPWRLVYRCQLESSRLTQWEVVT